ncbi:MAG: TRAP transporter small permease [Burkholderiaceae bacterium]
MKKFLDHFEEYFVASLLAIMTLITCVNVFFRYVLGASIDWAFEVTTFLFAWLIFIGASWGLKIGAHIGVDAVVKLMPKNLQRIATLIAILCCILYASIILYGGTVYVYKMYDIGIMSQDIHWLPQWMPRFVLPLGYALVVYRLLQLLRDVISGKRTTFNLADEAKDAIDAFKTGEKQEARS